jgi:hypothetical protein
MATEQAAPEVWELSAPESLVLRDGRNAERAQLVKLGLLELVTRGSLRLVDATGRNWRGRPQVEKVLVSGHRPLPHAGPLAPIAAAYNGAKVKSYPDGTSGRTIVALAQAFASSERTRGDRYRDETIFPALAARGLASRETYRFLGLFDRTRWVLTDAGELRRAELIRLLDEGEGQLKTHLLRDPRDVSAALAGVGAAALLMTTAYPELNELSQRLRAATSSGDGGSYWGPYTTDSDSAPDAPSGEPIAPSLTPDPSPTATPSPSESADAFGTDGAALDFGSIDVGGIDFSAFDGIDSSFDAIDSGVDAGGGGDGGGNGGGDGGGGGD